MLDFEVVTQQLAYTADDFKSCSAAVSAMCANVSTAPPPAAFGQLPQSKALADALNACVKLTSQDLTDAVHAAERIQSGLDLCAKGYADTDSSLAEFIARLRNYA